MTRTARRRSGVGLLARSGFLTRNLVSGPAEIPRFRPCTIRGNSRITGGEPATARPTSSSTSSPRDRAATGEVAALRRADACRARATPTATRERALIAGVGGGPRAADQWAATVATCIVSRRRLTTQWRSTHAGRMLSGTGYEMCCATQLKAKTMRSVRAVRHGIAIIRLTSGTGCIFYPAQH